MTNEDYFGQYMSTFTSREPVSPEVARHQEFTSHYRVESVRINPPRYEYVNSYSGYRHAYPASDGTVDMTLSEPAFKQLILDAQLGRDMTDLKRQLNQGNPAVLNAWQELQTVLVLTR